MKLLIPALLCLLLLGCSVQPEEAEMPTEFQTACFSEEAEQLQAHYGSAAEVFSLPVQNVEELYIFRQEFLLRSGNTLILLDEGMNFTATCQLEFDPQIISCDAAPALYDNTTRQVLLLDETLSESRRIALPEDLSGSPVLSSSGNDLYYCTSNGIYVWDLEAGIRRRIKESSYPGQMLTGIHWKDQVLQCRIPEEDTVRDLFLDSGDGRLLQEMDTEVTLVTAGDLYYCSFLSGRVQNLIFGQGTAAPRALFPKDFGASGIFLPGLHCAATIASAPEDRLSCSLYRLDTGYLQDTLILESEHHPKAILSSGSSVVMLISESGQDFLLKWTPSPESETQQNHTDPYYTAENPDHAGLSLCRDYAARLSRQFGVEIRIWKDAVSAEPWDYSFEPEHRYPVLLEQLQTLESCLSLYPASLLTDTAAHFEHLKICLVRDITGIGGSQSLSTATGIQFLEGPDAYVVLCTGPYLRQALYHELFHVMETHILSCSNALDRWEELNPSGFSYDLDHSANARRNSGVYLEAETRAFVDTYSMSFPKEDRARIFEYAMLPDMDHLFCSDIMQSKLQAICTGIQEAYGLKESGLWEQYLK